MCDASTPTSACPPPTQAQRPPQHSEVVAAANTDAVTETSPASYPEPRPRPAPAANPSPPAATPPSDHAQTLATTPATAAAPSPGPHETATNTPADATTTSVTSETTEAPAAPADPTKVRRDLTDVPPDVLPMLFSRLPPGQRLDLRAACRAWRTWVNASLAASTNINIVLDAPELRRALQRQLKQRHHSGIGGGAAGLLAAKFPSAISVRLWAGCRPSPALAGRNGCAGSSAAKAPQLGVSASASALFAQAAVFVALSLRQLRALLGRAAVTWLASCLQVAAPRQPPWGGALAPRRCRPEGGAGEGPGWHVHRSGRDTDVALLWRYAPDPPDSGLLPLSACLPLLGPSTSLMRLSLVTAHDLMQQDLRALRESFPRLVALALHSHRDATLDFKPAALPPLEPFLPAKTTTAAAAAVAAAGPPSLGGGAAGVTPAEQPLPLRSLAVSGFRLDWADAGDLAALTQLRALVLHRTSCRMHRLMPQIAALTQLTRLELRGLDYHHSMPLDAVDMWLVAERMEFLDHRRGERRCRAAAAATASPSTAARVRVAKVSDPRSDGSEDEDEWEEACRVGGGVDDRRQFAPWMWAPTSVGASVGGCARPDWHAVMRALGRAVRGMEDLKLLVCDVECPPAPPLPPMLRGRPEVPPAPAAERGEEAPPALFPDAPTRARRGAWELLLAGVCRLRNLQELRLPYMVLHSPRRVVQLAEALPVLATLELAGLPTVPREPRGWDPEQHSGAAAAMDALWQRYRPLRGGAGDGGAAAATRSAGNREKRTEFEEELELEVELEAGPGLDGFRQLRELVLHRGGVRQLSYWLPLPPRLQRLQLPIQRADQPASNGIEEGLRTEDLVLLHARLLPALSRLSDVAIKLHRTSSSTQRRPRTTATATAADNTAESTSNATPAPPSRGPATCSSAAPLDGSPAAAAAAATLAAAKSGDILTLSMLAAWLHGNLTSLDLSPIMAPLRSQGDEAALACCLAAAVEGLPRLRTLSCYLAAGTGGPMDVGGPAAARGNGDAGRGWWRGGGRAAGAGEGAGGDGDSEAEALSRRQAAPPCTALMWLNAMPCLEELRVKVFAPALPPRHPTVYGSNRTSYHAVRVPLGLLLALQRPVRVVDCSPLVGRLVLTGRWGAPPGRAAAGSRCPGCGRLRKHVADRAGGVCGAGHGPRGRHGGHVAGTRGPTAVRREGLAVPAMEATDCWVAHGCRDSPAASCPLLGSTRFGCSAGRGHGP